MKSISTILIVLMSLTTMAQSTFLKSFSYWDRAEANVIFEESDGYVVGLCADIGESGYLILLKTNFDGDSVWTKKFILNKQSANISDYIIDASGNKIIIVPQIGGANNIFKFDNSWNLIYNGSMGLEAPYKIKILNDNNYLLISRNQGFHILHKINGTTLDNIWTGDSLTNEYYYMIANMIETSESEIILTTKNTYFDEVEISSTIYKINSDGHLISEFTFDQFVIGSTKYINDNLYSLVYRDGNSGAFNSLITYSPDGTIIDSIDITTANTSYREFIEDGNTKVMVGLHLEPGDNFYHTAIGSFTNDQITWSKNHGDPNSNVDKYYPSDIVKTSDNGYLIVGTISMSNNSYLPYLLKTDSVGNINTVGLKENGKQSTYAIYPNPASEFIKILPLLSTSKIVNVELYNSNGILISNKCLDKENKLNVRNLTNGVYILKITSNNSIEVCKFIID